MAPRVINLRTADDGRDVVHRAVQALAEGRIVAFPTETVYGLAVSALNADAVAQLLAAKGRDAGHAFTLAIKSADDALDYIPNLSALGQRLTRRCWPGPITLVFDDNHPDSVVKQLPKAVRAAVCPEGTIGLRVPAHPLILSVLRLSPGPLALTSANLSGEPAAVTAEDVVKNLGDKVALVLDDGRSKFAQASSVVKVAGNKLQILRAGVFPEHTIRRLSGLMVLFVCTGNTCRSPMAEVLMRKKLAEKFGCRLNEVEDRGVLVASAGIAAMGGGRAAQEAIETMSRFELDLRDHASQPLTERLALYADYILTMTHGHRQAIVAQWPQTASRTFVLCHDGRDIADPIGGPAEMYESCAAQIGSQIDAWVERLDLDSLPELKSSP